jgi:hypothetical protein
MRLNQSKDFVLRTFQAMMAALCLNALCIFHLPAEDVSGHVKQIVEKSTLDEPGTKPFHLKASFAPSLDRDKGTNRVGEIEIWWQSPTKWRREVRSPEFHQFAIMDGGRRWEKNDGDYFPDWLRELVEAIMRPIPFSTDVLVKRVKSGEVRHMMGLQTVINWDAATDFGDEQANGKGDISFIDKTGLLLYTNGPGFGGLYHDFKDFHGRMIAYTVASGYTEVTAKIGLLEDLVSVPDGFFDTNAPGADAHQIDTVVLSEGDLRKNLLSGKPFQWPALTDGPLEGVVWTEVVIDRTGKIREMIPPIADNPGVEGAAESGFRSMQFQPILCDGVPVQATGRLSVAFKTVRPAGTVSFDSARNYFERGRKASFLAAGATAPYILRAEFQVGTASGVQTGRYEDTWVSATEWKREAWIGPAHLVKSQSGDKHYVLAEGAEAGMLRMVMQFLEPIPAEDTMTESDWRIRADMANGVKAVRVFRGPEGPNGELEPGKSQGFWFDDAGHLVKSYTAGFELRPSKEENYGDVQVAKQIDVLKDGKVGMRIIVKEVGPADPSVAKDFKMKGHEWQRAFTAEVR